MSYAHARVGGIGLIHACVATVAVLAGEMAAIHAYVMPIATSGEDLHTYASSSLAYYAHVTV